MSGIWTCPIGAPGVRRKGGAVDVIVWQTGTARLLPRLFKGRKSGPVFLTDRKASVELPPGDIDPGSGRTGLTRDPLPGRQARSSSRKLSGTPAGHGGTGRGPGRYNLPRPSVIELRRSQLT
jgi:hypothetical protein